MHFISEELENYCIEHSSKEDELLKFINRETHAKVLMPRMLSGHQQGLLLQFISCMIRPKHILEIGTYTGYSALSLCKGLQEGGKLITIDKNLELEERVRSYFEKSSYNNSIEYILGDARTIVPTIQQEFDLVFIDADKISYALYYDMVFDKVRSGGFILVDNVLWSGKILGEKRDKDTIAIDDFNKKIANDTRVEKMILPFRDGITLIGKI
jgi:predicted O-methyltransferase YrrM